MTRFACVIAVLYACIPCRGSEPGITNQNSFLIYLRLAKEVAEGKSLQPEWKMNSYLSGDGFMNGFLETQRLIANDPRGNLPFKLPDDMTAFEASLVVEKFAAANPEKLVNQPNAVVVWNAMVLAYPNPKFIRLPPKAGGR
jgi:hypothetical protein